MEQSQGVSGSSLFDDEDCISYIISFTSPRDACVVASVSKTFESAANSDIVWEKFLPKDKEYPSPSRKFSSKKELYLALCDDPLLSQDGKKSFWLEKATGKKCIMLSAKDISIIWGDDPQYWQWIPLPESRFEKVAELIHVWWFEIRVRTNTHFLSPTTRYSAYIVFKKGDQCYGFKNKAIEAGVGMMGQEASRRFICLDSVMDEGGEEGIELVKPEEREDGWMEIELGEFFNQGGFNSDEIEMSALHTEGRSLKRDLIIQGIEIRPSKVQ